MENFYLDRNENNYGPAPACLEVARNASTDLFYQYSTDYKQGMKSILSGRLSKEFNIPEDKIIMPGYVDNIWEYYKAMDIFLLPSRSEGFSLALLEAAAAKLPIIATNIPGTNEFIINGENGILFEPGKPEELLNGIIKLTGDKLLAKKLAKNAHEKVLNNFTHENYGTNLDNFLESALKSV